MIRRIVLMSAIAALGCDSQNSIGPDENGRVPGTLEHYGDEVRIEIPTSAAPGEDFTVAVFTYGDGCVSRGETESDVQGLTATIRPYDYDHSTANSVCTQELRIHRHEATLRFAQPGSARVTVFGRQLPGGNAITATRTVLIQ